jgi:predicted permease
MIAALTNAFVPIFAGLLIGYLALLWKVVDNQNVCTLIIFVMSVALPCSLFFSVDRLSAPALEQQAQVAIVLAPHQRDYAVMISAIPSGFFGVVFGKNFPNAVTQITRASLLGSYVVGIFTIAGWMVLLSYLEPHAARSTGNTILLRTCAGLVLGDDPWNRRL